MARKSGSSKSGKSSPKSKQAKFHPCSLKQLPMEQQVAAAEYACSQNPCNAPVKELIPMMAIAVTGVVSDSSNILSPQHLAVLTGRMWPATGVRLTVGFMENTKQDLADRIISHANSWGQYANVKFSYTDDARGADVRISRRQGGYWSYLGVDIKQISANQATMNLEGFSMSTPESEYVRVVRHEFGHTLGFPHEHLRRQLVQKLDRNKTIAYFQRYQGWDSQTTISNVLTPLEERSIRGTTEADQDSIMSYSLPGQITVDGQPIRGGNDINALDGQFIGSIYPLSVQPPPPPTGTKRLIVEFTGDYKIVAQ